MAHRTTEWRRKMKLEDPDRYQRYLQDARERNKKNRDKLKQALQKKKPDKDSFEKKKHMLDLQRQRQKVYLDKKKTEKTNENLIVKFTDSFQKKQKTAQTTPQNKPKTRHNVQARREYNRKKKQEERSRQTYQKQMWIRKKDRERKQQKRECMLKSAKTPDTSLPASAVTEAEAGFRSKKTEWNVTSQIRSKLPETPEKFAKVVDNLVQNATPRKRKAVEQLCGKRKKPRVITRGKHPKFRTAAYLIKRSFKRRRAVDVIGIQKFYMREDISQVMPNKRFATKDGPGYIMQVPIRSAHSKYLSENKDKQVSLAKFASLRKKNVPLIVNTKLKCSL